METEQAAKPRVRAKTAYRVLHVLDHSWPEISGYAIRSRGIIQGQKHFGFSPEVVTGPLHQISRPDDTDDAVHEGIPYYRTALGSDWRSASIRSHRPVAREWSVVRLLQRRIESLLLERRFDLIHAHSPALCGLAAVRAAHAHRLPCVYEIRAFWEDAAVDQGKTTPGAPRYRLTRALESRVVRRAEAVVGIATYILSDLEQRGIPREKLFHVSNGVESDRVRPQPRDNQLAAELGIRDGEFVLMFIGSLYRFEGVSWIVRGVAELRRRGVPIKLIVAGNGEDLEPARAAVAENSAGDYVSLLGRVPNAEVQRYYSVADAMVYPRLSVRLTELVTPLKPLEAMAVGKPILASDVGGIRELVDERTGVLFHAGDLDDFCAKAALLASDPELCARLAAAGRQHAVEEKDWNVLAGRYEPVYDYAVARVRRAEAATR